MDLSTLSPWLSIPFFLLAFYGPFALVCYFRHVVNCVYDCVHFVKDCVSSEEDNDQQLEEWCILCQEMVRLDDIDNHRRLCYAHNRSVVESKPTPFNVRCPTCQSLLRKWSHLPMPVFCIYTCINLTSNNRMLSTLNRSL